VSDIQPTFEDLFETFDATDVTVRPFASRLPDMWQYNRSVSPGQYVLERRASKSSEQAYFDCVRREVAGALATFREVAAHGSK
jgi:hypothetical protein